MLRGTRRGNAALADKPPVAPSGDTRRAVFFVRSGGVGFPQIHPDFVGIHLRALKDTSPAAKRVREEKGTGVFCAKHPKGRSGKILPSPFPFLVRLAR